MEYMSYVWIASIIGTLIIADQKKLSMVGYFFLSLFTGPLAVIIVLLLPSKTGNNAINLPAAATLEGAQRQLGELKSHLFVLQQKINNLENLLNSFSGQKIIS